MQSLSFYITDYKYYNFLDNLSNKNGIFNFIFLNRNTKDDLIFKIDENGKLYIYFNINNEFESKHNLDDLILDFEQFEKYFYFLIKYLKELKLSNEIIKEMMEWKNQLVETNKENIKLKTKIFYKPLFIISTNNKLNDDIKIIYHKIINTSINFTNEFLSLFKTILDCSSTLKDNYNKMLIENDKYFLLNYKINKIKLSSLNFNSIDNKYISLLQKLGGK